MALGFAWILLAASSMLHSQEMREFAAELAGRAAAAAKRPEGIQEAIRLYRELAGFWLKERDSHQQARALLAASRLEAQTGDKARAKAGFSEAAALFHDVGDVAGEGDAIYGIARQQFDLGEIPQAIANYERAAALKQQTGDAFGQALTIHNLGAALSETGETARALACYRQALDIRTRIADRPGIGYSLYGIATIYWARADYEQALDTYRRALDNWRVLGDRNGEANSLNSMGLALQALGDRVSAAKAYQDALRIWRDLKNPTGEAYTLNNMALAAAADSRLDLALHSYQNALILLQRAGDRRAEAYVLHNMADLEVQRGHRALATRMYEESLATKHRIGDRYGEAYTLQKIGEGRQELGDIAGATQLYRRALSLHRAAGDRAGEAAALAALARAAQARGDVSEARAHMLEAIGLIESLRVEVAGDELRASYFAGQQDYYEYMIALLMRMHREREAFEFSERTRGRVLLDAISSDADGRSAELRGRIREESARLRRGNPTVPSQLDSLIAAYGEARADTPPRVHGFRPLTAGEIQNSVIERGSLLIEYCLGREASYAWLVGHDSIGSVRLPPRQIIEAAVRRYLSALQARADSGDAGNESRAARLRAADDALPAAAAALYRMLVAPFAARLGQARLLLVTDGILNTMPIEALPADNGEPLLAGREIVRLPAASLSPLLRSASPAPPGVRTTVAIVADPEPTGPSDLPPLRFSRAEAESIAAAMPTAKLALGRDAALARLRSPDFRQAAILHFATHVAIDDAHPARSGLVLSNGILRPDDISGLGLAARTVVLSGCRTALGEPLRGEGLIGMTRAFLLAGASRVIASLWDVQDQATARLMGEFYSGLLVRKLAPAAALRSAQLSLRSDPRFSHPYYWAGFILTGDWKP